MPAGTIKCDRTTIWGNSFVPGPLPKHHRRLLMRAERVPDRAEAVRRYAEHAPQCAALVRLARERLRGHDLACWCGPDESCHVDVLLEIANS